MDGLIDAARFAPDDAAYQKAVASLMELAFHDLPAIPICQPLHDVAMQKVVGGYQYWPCREPDFRRLTKA